MPRRLGMPLAQVIQILKADCNNLKDVNVIYDEQRPMDKKFDLIVDLSQNGLRLRFDPLVQRLKVRNYDVLHLTTQLRIVIISQLYQ